MIGSFHSQQKRLQSVGEVDEYAHLRRGYLLRRMGYDSGRKFEPGYLEAALDEVDAASKIGDQSLSSKISRYKIMFEIDLKHEAQAKKAFTELHKVAPSDYNTYYAGYYLNSSLKRYDDATGWLKLAIANSPTKDDKAGDLHNLADLYYEQKKYPEAIKIHEEILKDPNATAWEWHNSAIVYLMAEDWDKCIEHEKKALSMMEFGAAKMTLSDAYYWKAARMDKMTSFNEEDNWEKLLPVQEPILLEALKWNSENTDVLVMLGRLHIGAASKNKAELDKAKEYIDRAVAVKPNDSYIAMLKMKIAATKSGTYSERRLSAEESKTFKVPPSIICRNGKCEEFKKGQAQLGN
jgi:tetratricopeptide (TPR) repeat protein